MSPPKYGAIASSDEEQARKQQSDFERVEGAEERGPSDYEMGQTYYLKPSKSRKALVRGLVPIVIALLIIGGVGYYFFEDVLNPGGGHHGSGKGEVATTSEVVKSTTKHIPLPPKDDDGGEDAPSSSFAGSEKPKDSSSSSAGSCAARPKCVATGLTGMCCPAAGGIMLECCK